MNLAQKQEASQLNIVPFPKKGQETMAKEESYTRLPNSIIDDLVMAELSDKAFKCLMLIVRQTIGFGKATDSISTSQFKHYCGIKKDEKVHALIREIEGKNFIRVERKKGLINRFSLTLTTPQKEGESTPDIGGWSTPSYEVVPINGGSPQEEGGSTPDIGGGSTPKKGGSTKEILKETINKVVVDNTTPKFEPQNKTMLHFIEYYPSDSKSYSLKDLIQVRPVESDFKAQAKISFPNLSDEIIQNQFTELCQWSLTASKLTSQKWMSTWIKFLKSPKPTGTAPVATTKPKPYNSRNVNDAWGAPKQYAPCNPNSNTEGGQ